jgi:stress response protein SCP2
MFRLFVTKAESLHAADFNGKSDPYCIVEHKNAEGRLFRIGVTSTLGETLNPTWDANRTHPIEFPFTDSSDSTVKFSVWDSDRFGADDFLGSISVTLNDVPLRKDLPFRLETPTKDERNPMLWIWVESGFEKLPAGEPTFAKFNFFYVFFQYPPRSAQGATAELQIYQSDQKDGSCSNRITKVGSGGVTRQFFKSPLNPDGCDQLYRFDVAHISEDFVFLPLVKVSAHPGEFTISFAQLSFKNLPPMDNENGVSRYDKMIFDPVFNPKPVIRLVHQHGLITASSGELYSDNFCFRFTKTETEIRQVSPFIQEHLPFETFTRGLRRAILPPNTRIWDHRRMLSNQIMTVKSLWSWHDREYSGRLKFSLDWKGVSDLDISACALNKDMNCVGHVSFHDPVWFDRALQHSPPVRQNLGGIEEVSVSLSALPRQVKAILIVLTSYQGGPLAYSKGTLRVLDDADQFELMFTDRAPSGKLPGMLILIVARRPKGEWGLAPAFHCVAATKPYEAHSILKKQIKEDETLSEIYDEARFGKPE